MSAKPHESTGSVIKAECSCCRVKTSHNVLAAFENSKGDEILWVENIFQIIQCQRCEGISFRSESFLSENAEPEIHLYPSGESV
ncbi:MAG: hypothetical protein WCV67_15415 [Victivallaceae bacterium]